MFHMHATKILEILLQNAGFYSWDLTFHIFAGVCRFARDRYLPFIMNLIYMCSMVAILIIEQNRQAALSLNFQENEVCDYSILCLFYGISLSSAHPR